jgi:hypothetical protein
VRRDVLRRPGRDQLAARIPALRAEVDEPVGLLDHVEVVLDHEHRVPVSTSRWSTSSSSRCPRSAARSSARRGCRGAPAAIAGSAASFTRCASTGQRRRRLAERHVVEPNIVQRRSCRRIFGLAKKRSASSTDISSTSAIVLPLNRTERLAVVAAALAGLAGDVHVGQEVHLDLDLPVALQVSQRPPDVEREAAGL